MPAEQVSNNDATDPKLPANLETETSIEQLSMTLTPASANEFERTIEAVWYTGQAVDRFNYMTGEEYTLTLGMEPDQVDLSRLNSGAPVLDSHNTSSGGGLFSPDSVRAQLGVVQRAWVDKGVGKATLKFSSRDDVTPLWNDIKAGIVRNLSVGTRILAKKDVTASAEGSKKSFFATRHQPMEISVASIPADYGTQFLTGQSGGSYRLPNGATIAWIAAPNGQGNANQTITFTDVANGQLPNQKEQPVDTQQQDAGAEARKHEEQLAAAVRKAAEDATKTERERANSIRLIAAPFKIDAAYLSALIEKNTTVDQARVEIMDKLAADADKQPTIIASNASVTRDEAVTRRQQMAAALLNRFDMSKYPLKENFGREYRGYSLIELARMSLENAGRSTRGMSKNEIATECLVGAMGTSDFPNVTADVANKTLQDAYTAASQSWKLFCRQRTASDFKNINSIQFSEVPTLELVNENGEIHSQGLSDSKEVYKLATYAKIIKLSRKVIINDDLGAFTRIPQLFGTAAANLETNTVWGIITANAAMGDAVALFHADHDNLLEGVTTALSLGGLDGAYQALAAQTGPDGATYLNLVPRYLLVPTGKALTAGQLIAPAAQLAASDSTKVVPDYLRQLIPIAEPRLEANDSDAYYVVADPSQIDTIDYAYLDGQQGVYTESRMGFEVDGMEIKARLDFAAKAIDFRGMVKCTGVT